MRGIKHIVIHCAATLNGRPVEIKTLDDGHAARGFRRQDAAREKFNPELEAIGYHYLIGVDGTLHTGRHEDEVGAHVQGSNATSIGICMIGTDKFTAKQWATLAKLVVELMAKHRGAKICGHRDFSPDLDGDGVIERHEWLKECPCFDVSDWLYRGMEPLEENVF